MHKAGVVALIFNVAGWNFPAAFAGQQKLVDMCGSGVADGEPEHRSRLVHLR